MASIQKTLKKQRNSEVNHLEVFLRLKEEKTTITLK
jgi:hypothetical protein